MLSGLCVTVPHQKPQSRMIEVLNSSEVALLAVAPAEIARGPIEGVFEHGHSRQVLLSGRQQTSSEGPANLVATLLDHPLLQPPLVMPLSCQNLNLLECHGHPVL